PSALRSQGTLCAARSRDNRQHDRVLRTSAAGRHHSHAPNPALDQRTENDEARHRSLLGDRRRVSEPKRRGGRRRVVHGLWLPERVMSLLLEKVQVGDRVPELRYDVSATTIVLGALAARDWRPMHHDHDFAVNRNGTQDIFMNTPNQAAWFER